MISNKSKQRPDFTHKYNRNSGRHGWLRLTPAYSVKLVDQILNENNDKDSILDPFSGTATTPLCASYYGINATAIEINPFLVWFGQAKTAVYSELELKESIEIANNMTDKIIRGKSKSSLAPKIHNIERWWNHTNVKFLCELIGELQNEHAISSERTRNILLIAFCRLMIKISNVSFNHQSMSFKNSGGDLIQTTLHSNTDEHLSNRYIDELRYVLNSASANPVIWPTIIEGDSKHIHNFLSEKFDLIITSPPYPNRMSYIRELRPYMYWLGYLKEASEAGELDWKTIGGTWGIATSRLSDWKPCNENFSPDYFKELLITISDKRNENGVILANYVRKYFEDIWIHLQSLKRVLRSEAEIHYIVGNSTFYGVLIPVERLYQDMFEELGFQNVKIETIRKRSSKKELYEFDVKCTF